MKDVKKILFIFHFTEMGGAERLVFDITKNMDRTRVQPVVVCLVPTYKALKYKGKYSESQIVKMGEKAGQILDKHQTPFFMIEMPNLLCFSTIQTLRRLIKKEQIQNIFCLDSQPERTIGLISGAMSPGKKFVLSMHYDTYDLNQTRYLSLLDTFLLRFVDQMTATSEYHKNLLVKREHISSSKIKIIHNGLDLSRFDDSNPILSRPDFGLTPETRIVGIVARLVPMKGHSVLLEAAVEVLKKEPNTCFMIIGDGVDRQKLERMCTELSVENNVLFLGTREDVPSLVPLFDVAVLCSRSEIFGISLLEYMAAGRPVIASNVGGIPEIITEGETGLLVEPGNPGALAKGILRLLKNPVYAEKLGSAAKIRVAQGFNMKKMIEQIERLFAE